MAAKKKKTPKKPTTKKKVTKETPAPSEQDTTEFEVQRVTEDELLELTRWARVAFAARCARRVQPLFVHAWPDVPDKYVQAIDEAIALAENSAATAAANNAAANAANNATAAATAATAAATATNTAAAHAAAAAARAARGAANTAANATNTAANAAKAYNVDGLKTTLLAIRTDYEQLLETTKTSGWDDKSPVPPSVFGPMWPDAPPDNWPTVDHETGRPIEDQIYQLISRLEAVESRSSRWGDSTRKTDGHLDTLDRRLEYVQAALDKHRTELTELVDRSKDMAEQAERLSQLEKDIKEKEDKLDKRVSALSSRLPENLVGRLDTAENKVKESILRVKTGEPMEFWRARQQDHHTQFERWRWYVLTAGSIGVAIAFVVLLIGFFGGGDDDINVWRIGSAAFIATLVLLLLRVMTRITMSHLHLATEAEERVVMIEAYLALLGSTVLPKEMAGGENEEEMAKPSIRAQHETLILNALFRPSTTGLVKDDAVPASVLDLATRVASGNKAGSGS